MAWLSAASPPSQGAPPAASRHAPDHARLTGGSKLEGDAQAVVVPAALANEREIASAKYTVGEAFPSVRAIAAHNVIQHLLAEKWLEARPGIGTVVADRAGSKAEESTN